MNNARGVYNWFDSKKAIKQINYLTYKKEQEVAIKRVIENNLAAANVKDTKICLKTMSY
jgi:hypothetical protein